MFLALFSGVPLVAPAPATATPGSATRPPRDPLVLRWSAPSDCPGGEQVLTEVGRTLAQLEGPPERIVEADAEITRTDEGRYALTLELAGDDMHGTRRLEAASCEQLADAAALIMAIAVDPRAAEQPTDAPPIQSPSRPDEPAPAADGQDREGGETTILPRTEDPSRPVASPSAPAPATPRLRVELQPTAGVGLVLLPGTAAALGLDVTLGGRLWRAELGGSYWTPSEERSESNQDVGGRLQLWTIAVRGCGVPFAGPVDFPLCAGIEGGGVHGRGIGELDPRRASNAAWAAAFAGAAVLWRPAGPGGRLGLLVRAEGIVALVRPAFETDRSGVIYRVPPAGARVVGGVAIGLR